MTRCFIAVVACAVLEAGCSAKSMPIGYECVNADVKLLHALSQLESARAEGCQEHKGGDLSCTAWEREIDHLSLVCPSHVPTLFARAVMVSESQPETAQRYLDQVLASPGRWPDAVALRARLAIRDGNLPFARRLLSEQIKLSPDHAGLRETYGAVLYLSGRLDDARQELLQARAMGAPEWRVAYHLGLVEEAGGRPDEAIRLYTECLEKNPNWAQAQSRLNALRRRGQ